MPGVLIIVTGAPATGKSTLAPLVARRYSCVLLDKDTIKEELFDLLGQGDAAWSRRLSDASFATLFALAADGFAAGMNLVLEGNFRPREHEAAIGRVLAGAAAGVRCAQVLCVLPEAVQLVRLEERARAAPRHAGHLDAARTPSANTAGFLDIPAARFEFDSAPHNGPGADKSSKASADRLFLALDAYIQQAN